MAQSKEERREKRREYYIKNREKLRANAVVYSQSHKAERNEYARKYIAENKELVRTRHKKWEQRAAKHLYDNHKKWIEENPLMNALYGQRRRHRNASRTHNLTLNEWIETIEYFGGVCAYCGEIDRLQQDHVVPFSRGGEHIFGNIVLSCVHCNSKKHAKLFSEWYPTFEHYSKERENKVLEFIKNYNK
jgi:5-methylcytosine-specific restriction endonuclease McrA